MFARLRNIFKYSNTSNYEITWKVFNIFFQMVCLSVAVSLAFLCYLEFIRDEDFCEVSFKNLYKENENMLPSVSMCFTSPIYNENLQKYGKGLNYTTYEDIIVGQHNEEKLSSINFEDVSMHLQEYIKHFKVIALHEVDDTYKNMTTFSTLISSISTRNWVFLDANKIVKCFSFGIPFKTGIGVNSLEIQLNSSVFPNAVLPRNGWTSYFGFHLYFHRHNQFIRSFASRKTIWEESKTTSHKIIAYLSGIEVIRRRQKSGWQCIENTDYDSWVYRNITKSLGCKAPYWTHIDHVPNCKRKKDLQYIAQKYWDMFTWNLDSNPPCTEIKRIQIDYEEQVSKEDKGAIAFTMAFRDPTYKEIKQNPAYDTKKLFGDIGGYIGLLLGYALIKLPEFLLLACARIQKSISEVGKLLMKKSITHDTNEVEVLECENKDGGENVKTIYKCSTCFTDSLKDEYSRMTVLVEHMKKNYEDFTEQSEELKERIQFVKNIQNANALPK